jgi:hypothetical protein
MVKSHHKMILSSGRFSGTNRSQLRKAFDNFATSEQKDRLVIHFHGGVVPLSDAETIAEGLMETYLGAAGYPFFVMWQTGVVDVLKNNWREITQEDISSVLVERISQFIIGKLDQSPGEKGEEVELPTKFEIQDEITTKQAADQEPFFERDTEAADLDPELNAVEQAQFEAVLEGDADLTQAALKLNREDAPELNPTLEDELSEARIATDPGDKGIISTATLAAAGMRILKRILKRFSAGSDHGIYTTVVEEVARELKGDLIGGIVWKHMKKDTADSFDGPAHTCGGTALLEEIGRIWKPTYQPRIVLVGHSAGSVYICNLLKKAAEILPEGIRFEVIFLAPGCSFNLLNESLTAASDRVAAFRSFGLSDELERTDAIFKPLYLRSLLYFVAGLLEETVDLPLVGMKRYHPGMPFDSEAYPEIQAVYDQVAAFPEPWVWSESTLGPGLNSMVHTHGAFDNEAETLKSVAHMIAHGVD